MVFAACLAGCGNSAKKTSSPAGPKNLASDTTGDVKQVQANLNWLVLANRIDDALNYINLNLHRFRGLDRAVLLNERGGVYQLRDDPANAVADYLSACDLDPQNPAYLINAANAYDSMDQLANARIFAQKVLQLPNLSDSDKAAAQLVMTHSDRIRESR